MPLSNFTKNKVLDEVTGRSSTMDLGTIYLGLSTTQPSESGTSVTNITEPSASAGYVRALLGSSSQSLTLMFPAAANGTVTNDKQIKFDMATGSWGTCTYAVLFNAATGGNVIGWSALTSSITVAANEVAVVPVGGVTITLT